FASRSTSASSRSASSAVSVRVRRVIVLGIDATALSSFPDRHVEIFDTAAMVTGLLAFKGEADRLGGRLAGLFDRLLSTANNAGLVDGKVPAAEVPVEVELDSNPPL